MQLLGRPDMGKQCLPVKWASETVIEVMKYSQDDIPMLLHQLFHGFSL